jgi:DNA-binding beta-propeller fold protein YncE
MAETVHAPKLDAGVGWLNTDRPLRFGQELKGQVVVLDFWTYCCINCIHILPDLAFLEHKYAKEPVTFIGVHSAKFTNEANRETIRAAILRYEIQHPVVIDDQMKIWRAYAVRSWPTVVVIDPGGHIVGVAAGEGNREVLDGLIAQALAQGRALGALATGPLQLPREGNVRAASGLSFPGKVVADAVLKRLFVADSNHNRVVIAELPDSAGRARLVRVVGSGAIGAANGSAESASFNHPQGLAAANGNLYVCDTENHLIRKIDLETYEVETVVGTGVMENDRAGGGMGRAQGLNSPWDVVAEGSTLYVAMAGTHQVWRIDMPVGFARALAGTGRENLVDGPTETSAFAQCSGICAMGGKLYVADSEVSAIRGIDMASETVFTVMGEGLFSFGDVDGVAPKAKLQHPLGVASWGRMLVVADTYNHKIKVVDPAARSVRTLFGTGKPGASTDDGKPAFFEPGGLSVAGQEVFVADTNNHRVVRVNLTTGAWCEVVLDGLQAPPSGDVERAVAIQAAAASVADGRDVDLLVDVRLPTGAKLNGEAPWSIRVTDNGTTLVQRTGQSSTFPLSVRVPAERTRAGAWRVSASMVYCVSDGGLCVPKSVEWDVPVRGGGTSSQITLSGE